MGSSGTSTSRGPSSVHSVSRTERAPRGTCSSARERSSPQRRCSSAAASRPASPSTLARVRRSRCRVERSGWMRARCRASRRTADSRAATSASAARPASSPRACPSREEGPPSSTGSPGIGGRAGPSDAASGASASPSRRKVPGEPSSATSVREVPPFSKTRRTCLGPVQRRVDSRRPVSSFRTRSNHGPGPLSDGESVRASMTESLPSPDSTLRSRRTVRPGWRSSSSRRPGHGTRTFCTTAPASSGSSARATSRSSLGLSDTWGPSQKRNGPASRRAVRFSRGRVSATSSWRSSASPSAQPASSSRSSSSSSAPSVHPSGVSVRHSGRVSEYGW